MNIKELDNGYLIDNIFAYGCDSNYKQYINLKKTSGDNMIYNKTDNIIIDFPGEYDIKGFGIEVLEEKGQLHYIITKTNSKFAIVSHKKVLLNEKMNELIGTRILSDESLKEQLEKNELNGEIIVLGL